MTEPWEKFRIGDRVVVYLTSQPMRTYSQEERDIWDGLRGTVTVVDRIMGIDSEKGEIRFYYHDLVLDIAPPQFASIAEAEAWLEANTR